MQTGGTRPPPQTPPQNSRLRNTAALPMSLGTFRQVVPFGSDAVNRGLNAGVEEFHNHHDQHRACQQRHLDPGFPEPEGGGHHHRRCHHFLAERGLLPACAQALHGVAASVHDAAQAGPVLLRVDVCGVVGRWHDGIVAGLYEATVRDSPVICPPAARSPAGCLPARRAGTVFQGGSGSAVRRQPPSPGTITVVSPPDNWNG